MNNVKDYGALKVAQDRVETTPAKRRNLGSNNPTLAQKAAGIAVAAALFIGSITPAMARAVKTADEVAGAAVTPITKVLDHATRPANIVQINAYVPTLDRQ